MADNRITKRVRQKAENFVYSTIQKFGGPLGFPSGDADMRGGLEIHPPYDRRVPPRYIYNLRRNQSLINNAIEEKVEQTFRRGFSEWERRYIAKCPVCDEEFESIEPFRHQLGHDGDNITEDELDFSKPRPCPNDDCPSDEPVEFDNPDPVEKKEAQQFFDCANERGRVDSFLEGDRQNSVGQTFLEVCKEVAWDIESFDDGWMLFERDYFTNDDGEIVGWKLKGVHRAPPELMRYDIGPDKQEKGAGRQATKKGQDHYLCPRCRAVQEEYEPEDAPGNCEHCDGKLYPVYAVMLDQVGGDPKEYYIRGEFAHASMYEPSKFYGFSPIISMYEEARILEHMDSYYRNAYKERRAPRGAMVIRSSNAESVRSFNQQQMQKLREDPQHIPTFIDDTEGRGNPLTWQPLLKEPAEMQHMQMREWFLNRISAKWGVTAIFQNSRSESGQGDNMEIVVSNRHADRLRSVFNDVFIPALLSQLQITGWDKEVADVEEEDQMAEADLQGKFVRNAQVAQQVGAEVEWTEEGTLDIKPGRLEPPQQEEGGMMGGMMGGGGGPGGPGPGGPGPGPEGPGPGGPGSDDDGPSTPFDELMASEGESEGASANDGGRPYEANQMGGEPRSRPKPTDNRPIRASEGGGGGGDGGGGGGSSVTTGSSGYSNAAYGGSTSASTTNDGGTIAIFDHIEEMLDEEADDDDETQKSAIQRDEAMQQAKTAFNTAYGDLDIDADTIENYAEADKGISVLKEDNYGDWNQYPRVEHAAFRLYKLINENQ